MSASTGRRRLDPVQGGDARDRRPHRDRLSGRIRCPRRHAGRDSHPQRRRAAVRRIRGGLPAVRSRISKQRKGGSPPGESRLPGAARRCPGSTTASTRGPGCPATRGPGWAARARLRPGRPPPGCPGAPPLRPGRPPTACTRPAARPGRRGRPARPAQEPRDYHPGHLAWPRGRVSHGEHLVPGGQLAAAAQRRDQRRAQPAAVRAEVPGHGALESGARVRAHRPRGGTGRGVRRAGRDAGRLSPAGPGGRRARRGRCGGPTIWSATCVACAAASASGRLTSSRPGTS